MDGDLLVAMSRKIGNLDKRAGRLESQEKGSITGAAIGSVLSLPGLVGFWPMNLIGTTSSQSDARDVGGAGLHLTNTDGVYSGTVGNLASYVEFFGTTNDYLSRAHNAILAPSGSETHIAAASLGMTLGCWVWFDNTLGSAEALCYKYESTNRCYYLQRTAAGTLKFAVMNSNTEYPVETTSVPSSGAWHFVTGTWVPSAAVRIYHHDGDQMSVDESTTGIPATLDTDAAIFTVGADGDGNVPLNGRISFLFLCGQSVGANHIQNVYDSTKVLFA
jgi:hypothetical protein